MMRLSLFGCVVLFLLLRDGAMAIPSASRPGSADDTTPLHLRRELPPKVIVGYASECSSSSSSTTSTTTSKVETAVRQGVNVVIWAFYHLSPTTTAANPEVAAKFDLECIQDMIRNLDQLGFDDTVHLVSMGGWNGPHLDPSYKTGTDWFEAWNALVGNVFHGIDIDFEGNDDLTSDLNYMTVAELDKVGEIMRLAKQSGYIVTMAPAQSYLDIHTTNFTRYLNGTDPDRKTNHWHEDFSYFGRNLYAYWLAKYGDAIDLVMIQFYESWSRAAMEIATHTEQTTPERYLTQYVWDLNQPPSPGFQVHFGSDPDVAGMLPDDCHIALPLSKLVWGFANAWANMPSNGGRNYYFPPVTIQAAYQNLWDWMLEPRGMMFWNIDNEGEQGIYYARGLNEILHIRTNSDNDGNHPDGRMQSLETIDE